MGAGNRSQGAMYWKLAVEYKLANKSKPEVIDSQVLSALCSQDQIFEAVDPAVFDLDADLARHQRRNYSSEHGFRATTHSQAKNGLLQRGSGNPPLPHQGRGWMEAPGQDGIQLLQTTRLGRDIATLPQLSL